MVRPHSHSNAMAQCDPSNILYELKEMKYLLAERIQVEEANNRNLTCYTFGRIDHETIRASITAVMMEIRRARGERANMDELAIKGLRQSSLRAGNSEPESSLPVGQESSLPAGHRNSKK